MQQAKQGDFQPFDAHDWKVGIVVAQFNKYITDELLASALDRVKSYKVDQKNITVTTVAGSIEIPLLLQSMAKSDQYDVLLAIGCVIQGETPHFDYVCKFVSEGILRVQLDYDMPVGFGVLTCNNQSEALARQHLGGEHLDAVMHQAKVISS